MPTPIAKHVHAVAGGGRKTHRHSDADPGHGHDGLLPTPKVMAERHPAVVRMMLEGNFAEGKPFVAVKTGDWTWTDYGRIQITRDDLALIKSSFDEDVRRQKLPIINENHDSSRRVGVVKSVDFDGDDTLRVTPDYNPTGIDLIKNDQYGYCSPELIFDYQDAETGAQHPAVLSGLALTNKPRMKSLGGIACSEDGTRAAVMAFSEGTVTGTNAHDAAAALMAEMDPEDMIGDDGDPLPPCSWAPPYSDAGRCPGYTKVLIDGDGDAPGDLLGCCALAGDCNGYSPITTPSVVPTNGFTTLNYSEGNRMPDTPTPEETAPAAVPEVNPETTGTPEVPATPTPEPVAPSAEFSEKLTSAQTRTAELETQLKAEKSKNSTLSDKVAGLEQRFSESEARRAAQETAVKLATTKGRIDQLVADNKITPAEGKSFSEESRLMVFSEHEDMLDIFEARPKTAVDFGEKGHGEDPKADTKTAQLASAVKKFAEDAKKEGRSVTPQEAAAAATRAVFGAQSNG